MKINYKKVKTCKTKNLWKSQESQREIDKHAVTNQEILEIKIGGPIGRRVPTGKPPVYCSHSLLHKNYKMIRSGLV
jgi:hypothetical protein